MSLTPHRASVDESGNIILPGAGLTRPSEMRVRVEEEHAPVSMEEGVWYTPEAAQEPPAPARAAFAWEVSEEEAAAEPMETAETEEEQATQSPARSEIVLETAERVWSGVRREMYRVTNEAITEGSRQMKATIAGGTEVTQESARSVGSVLRGAWSFLTQPVWVPGKRKEPVQYSRGTLFALDTLRFGGTFATLFGLLFVSLNYQSFWAIAQSYVDPLAEVTGVRSAEDDKGVAEKLKRIPSLAVAGQGEGGLLAHLPPVGPPDNRIIIPKLDLNVPIVVPSSEPLLREDWKTLEEEIQRSLQDGVVHYPGTARPGQAGNFFVTGHSSYFPWAPGEYKSVFARLHNLNVGDEYWVFYNGDRHRYVIRGKKEIKPSDVSVLEQPADKRIATLMTCTPVGTTLRRLILTAEEVDPVTGLALEVGERGTEQAAPQVKMEMLPI